MITALNIRDTFNTFMAFALSMLVVFQLTSIPTGTLKSDDDAIDASICAFDNFGFTAKCGSAAISAIQNVDAFKIVAKNANGVTFNADLVLVRPDASPSTVFEQLIHTSQHRTGRYGQRTSLDGNAGATAKAVYEAANRLVNNQRAYGISDAEHAVNQARIEEFRNQLDYMGIPRD